MAVGTQACRAELQRQRIDLTLPSASPTYRFTGGFDGVQPVGGRIGTLEATDWRALSVAGERLFAPRGTVLFRAGDIADGLYVLINGRLRVVHEQQSARSETVLEAGALVGAAGAFGVECRAATVVAMRDSYLISLSDAALQRIMRDSPRAAMEVARTLALQGDQGAPARADRARRQAIAIIPAGPDVPVHAFAERLQGALEPYATSLLLRAENLDLRYMPGACAWLEDAVDRRRVIEWLNEQELSHDLVLYEADPAPTAWTRQCLRQADRILFVGCADTAPALSRLAAVLDDEMAVLAVPRTVVVLQPAARSQPVGAAAWLAATKAESHHHVWLDRPSDLARLARALTGRAIGLVLGSGGARCFTHLGVLQALQEAAVPVDAIGGVSVGAVIAAQVAKGIDLHTLVEQTRALTTRSRSLLGYTLPLVSLFSAAKIDTLLDDLFGVRRIEDLTLPFFCASSNLHTGELIIHRSGMLTRYLRASCAAPGLLPPVLDHGEILMDGAVLNATPVHAMRAFCQGGPVIASDVSAEIPLRQDYRFGERLSARRLLWSRINPLAKDKLQAPSIASILLRSAELSSVNAAHAEVQTADVYIRPPVGGYQMFDAKHFESLVAHGYRCAVEAIERWQCEGETPW